MRSAFAFLLALGPAMITFAQGPYFQQEVAYRIAVRLDDGHHQLHGQWTMDYTNHSPDSLTFLYFHLWPNAYASQHTAFARQQLRHGERDFYFARDEELGFIDSLQFRQGATVLTPQSTNEGPDVILLPLADPLPPGGTMTLETPFRVQLPRSFSRLGHVGQSYQLTQWYPKPAVYDRDGWHPMPYLDNGEFYSEFGTFDVTLTLPENYVVAATGTLQTPSEVAWLKTRAAEAEQQVFAITDPYRFDEPPFPSSSPREKTIRYLAERVHDFAWFADKRYHVLWGPCSLPDGRVIDLWAFFTDEQAHFWQRSILYLRRATQYYSGRVGSYPYPQVTAVQSTESKGGGMEYPMITLIGREAGAESLDNVITHEVGHNWFYGILASNERDHAWVNEGINSYYGQCYDREYHAPETAAASTLARGDERTDGLLWYWRQARRKMDQSPGLTSDSLQFINYWLAAYEKPAQAWHQLEAIFGRPALDRAMHAYFDQWAFHHPQPTDLRRTLEEELKQDLSWLFEGVLSSTRQQDYGLEKVYGADSLYLNLRNRGKLAAPLPLEAITTTGDTIRRLVAGFEGQRTLALPPGEYQAIRLDPLQRTLDLYPRDNAWRRGIGPGWRRYGLDRAELTMGEL
ncbi:MAG: M1 family metallopeptidase, partial [Lewinella sp.]|nr:M1 family metallopeptidase [Lewinella sp.]